MTAEIGVLHAEHRQEAAFVTDTAAPEKVWERDDAPAGSTEGSLLVHDAGGNPVRIAGPTHYHHLADGRIVGGYSGGTHYDDGSKVTRIVGRYEG